MDKSMTLEAFAHEALGNSDRKGYLSQIENGKRSITPLTAKRLADRLDLPEDVLAPMLSNQTSTPEDLEVNDLVAQKDALERQLMELSNQSGRAERLRDEGITEKAIIRLAQRIAVDTGDVGQAWLELQNAMDIAVRVQAEGQVKSNHGDFVDTVLERVAELARDGEYVTAGAEIDAALAREDEEHQARKTKLFDSGVEVALLDRDTAKAAALLVRKADLDAGGKADFGSLRALRNGYYETGRDKGSNLDSALAINLARLVLSRASSADQRGTAGNDLGIALWTLGEREKEVERLDQAVAAFTEALKEVTRGKVPMDWAMAQMNLGNALATLGERETGTERLDQAVVAYTEALKEVTRDRVPMQWAMTQMNLGTVLQTLGEREAGPERLDQAVMAYTEALREFTRDRVPMQWAMTQMNLGTVLATLGKRETGVERLDQAVVAYSEALKERTRDRVPMQWAMTRHCLAGVEISYFDKTQDQARLDAAYAYAQAAREVYVAARADHYINWIDEKQLAAIEERRRLADD